MKKGRTKKESQTSSIVNKRKKRRQFKDPEDLTLRLLVDESERTERIRKSNKHSQDEWKLSKYTTARRISKNTAYKRGRQFEYRVKKHFENQGYYVKRSYASKGAEDLIAIKRTTIQDLDSADFNTIDLSEVFLIQCKNLKVEKKLSKEDADRLKKLAKQCGATPLLAQNLNHKLTISEVD